MGNSRLTVNGIMIIVIIFSAMLFFFTVTMVEMVNPYGQNEYQPIEGTDLAVKHSSVEVNGLYQGPESTAQLVLEGNFGNDWGTTLSGSSLYLNKYAITSLGLIIPEVIRVDTETHEEEVLYNDAIIRGRCASGEMVILTDYVMPTNYPQITESELAAAGINIVIYANQLLRAAYPAMTKCAERILECDRGMEADVELCMPISEIISLI